MSNHPHKESSRPSIDEMLRELRESQKAHKRASEVRIDPELVEFRHLMQDIHLEEADCVIDARFGCVGKLKVESKLANGLNWVLISVPRTESTKIHFAARLMADSVSANSPPALEQLVKKLHFPRCVSSVVGRTNKLSHPVKYFRETIEMRLEDVERLARDVQEIDLWEDKFAPEDEMDDFLKARTLPKPMEEVMAEALRDVMAAEMRKVKKCVLRLPEFNKPEDRLYRCVISTVYLGCHKGGMKRLLFERKYNEVVQLIGPETDAREAFRALARSQVVRVASGEENRLPGVLTRIIGLCHYVGIVDDSEDDSRLDPWDAKFVNHVGLCGEPRDAQWAGLWDEKRKCRVLDMLPPYKCNSPYLRDWIEALSGEIIKFQQVSFTTCDFESTINNAVEGAIKTMEALFKDQEWNRELTREFLASRLEERLPLPGKWKRFMSS